MLARNKTTLLHHNVNFWHQCLAFSCRPSFLPCSLLTLCSSNGSHSSSNTTCFDSLKCVLTWLWHSPMPVFLQFLENKRWKNEPAYLICSDSCNPAPSTLAVLSREPTKPHPTYPTLLCLVAQTCPTLIFRIPQFCPRCGFESNGTLEAPLLSRCHSLPRRRSHPINCA